MSSKDIENLLRERLGTTSGRPLPSPDFESRVRRSLTPQVRSRRRAHALEGLVAIAAVLALAVVMLPWLISHGSITTARARTAAIATRPSRAWARRRLRTCGVSERRTRLSKSGLGRGRPDVVPSLSRRRFSMSFELIDALQFFAQAAQGAVKPRLGSP